MPYHVLISRPHKAGFNDCHAVEFGDYDKETVKQEAMDMDYSYPEFVHRVHTLQSDDQAAIDAYVNKLNNKDTI